MVMALRLYNNRNRSSHWLGRLFGGKKRNVSSRFRVQSLEDRLVPTVFDVSSLADNGLNTLRAALIGTGITLGPDTITFSVTGTITLTTGALTIPSDVTIIGPGASSLTVNGNNGQRVFDSTGAPAGTVINMSGLTITGGKAAGGAGLLLGSQSVTMTNCVVTGNNSTGNGGGIQVNSASGSLNLQNCTINNNIASGSSIDGGGIAMQAAASLIMNDTSVSGNSASDAGGGIYFFNGGKFTFTNSTIANNAGGSAAAAIGGGMYFFGTPTGPTLIQNCTISSNSVGGPGGGIVLVSFAGTLQVQNSTIVFNSATAAGSAGGGIAITSGNGTVTLDSTIVAKNNSQSGNGPDFSLTNTNAAVLNYSLVGVYNSGIPNFSNSNSQLGTKASPLDPLLGPLQFNNGTTKTHRPLSGSPAIDKGSNPAGLSFDQRGVSRVVGAGPDVGAVETAANIIVLNGNDSGPGSLRRAVQDSSIDANASTITFDLTFFASAKTINLTSGEIAITRTVTISGPGNLTVDAGGLSRHFNISGPVMSTTATINGMTLKNGYAGSNDGGSILVFGQMAVLSQLTLSNNTTGLSGSGGAVAAESAGTSLKLTDCSVVNNSSGNSNGDGGGIAVLGGANLTVQRTRISGNTCYQYGGGLYVNQGSATITDSTIDNNLVATPYSSDGGGIDFYSTAGTLSVVNTTISANKVTSGAGGGTSFGGPSSVVTIRNSTITGNSAGTSGGGICRINDLGGTLSLVSSVVSGNSATSAPDIKLNGTVTATRSAVGSTQGITTFSADGISQGLVGANLKLGPLTDNGGPLPTHLPAVDSPLVNQGSNPDNLPNDERGSGYGRVRSGGVDIGAVEAHTPFIVTNANDSGAGSLRQAVLDANNFTGPDTINFDASFGNPQTITLTSGEMAIVEALTINGPGAANCTVSGNNASRIFNTPYSGLYSPYQITISGLTLTAGKGPSNPNNFPNDDGGAIRVGLPSLTLNQCIVTGNSAPFGSGGGVAVDYGGSLTATDCTFSNNSSLYFGGGVSVGGSSSSSLSLLRCTVSGNESSGGGGIDAYRYLTLDSCTVSNNQANNADGYNQGGGGLFISTPASGSATIRNSTISGNKAQSSGGAIQVDFNVTLQVQNSTITNNTAVNQGGGLFRNSSGATTTLVSTIAAGNSAPTGPDISAPASISVNNSAIGNVAGFTLTGANNLPFGANLKLGLLANNGGPTQTQMPLAGSPLIDAGSNTANLSTDQRGISRVIGANADIGAVEVASPLVVTNANDAGPGSLRQCISDANINPGPDTITFDPTYFNVPRTITLTTGQLQVTDPVTITGPGSTLAKVNAQGNSRVLNIYVSGVGSVVTLSGLTLTGSNTSEYGGGIGDVVDTLTLNDVTVTGNGAFHSGGGIWVGGNQTTLNINNSTIANNFSNNSHGGGISFESGGKLNVYDSTIAGNFSYFAGGGIDMYFGGSLLLQGSTISSNKAQNTGGGIQFNGTVGANGLIVRNSTITGNSASDSGGGIAVQNLSGTLTVQNSTITANTTGNKGGGIANTGNSGIVSIESTIISGNSTNNAGPDISTPGTVNATTTLLGSLAGIGTFNPDAITTLNLGKNPMLGPLANNGGPTKTYALLPGSPAINNGSNPAFLSTDQRDGGFVRVFGGSPDIGAYEVQGASKVASVVVNGGAAQRSRVTTIAVNFDSVVNFVGTPESAFQLKRQSDGLVVGLSANVVNGATTTVNLTFTGPNTDFNSLKDGRYTLTVLANDVNGGNFDGNGDGVPGDDYTLVGAPGVGPNLFRFFGDINGDGTVSASDFIQFRQFFGGVNPAFDFNIDGSVAASDFIQFRLRFGGSI
jgi:hypothetical protein